MMMRRILLSAVLALSLAGCASMPGPLGDAVRVLTTTIENPVTGVDIYRVKNTYAAALEVAVEYRRYCWERPYAVLMVDSVARPICERRRAVVRSMQKAKDNASAAIAAAENFVVNHPTINASIAIRAAWDAVADFKNTVPVR